MNRYEARVAAQIEAIPPLETFAGQAYVRQQRGDFLAGTLVHILRRIHDDRTIPDDVALELIDRCKSSLLGVDLDVRINPDVSRLVGLIEWTAKTSFRADAQYTPGDFIHDFLVNYLFPALDGRDTNPYWIWRTHSRLRFRLMDARRDARIDSKARGMSEVGRGTVVAWEENVPADYSKTVDELEILGQVQEHAAVVAAVRTLPDGLRRALELYFEDVPVKKGKSAGGRSMEEIIGRSHTTIFAWLDQALALLREDADFLEAMVDAREGRSPSGKRRTKQSKPMEAP